MTLHDILISPRSCSSLSCFRYSSLASFLGNCLRHPSTVFRKRVLFLRYIAGASTPTAERPPRTMRHNWTGYNAKLGIIRRAIFTCVILSPRRLSPGPRKRIPFRNLAAKELWNPSNSKSIRAVPRQSNVSPAQKHQRSYTDVSTPLSMLRPPSLSPAASRTGYPVTFATSRSSTYSPSYPTSLYRAQG